MQTHRPTYAAAPHPTAVPRGPRLPLPGSPWTGPGENGAAPAAAHGAPQTVGPRGPRSPSPVGPWRVPPEADVASTFTRDVDVFDAGSLDRDDLGLLERGRYRAPDAAAPDRVVYRATPQPNGWRAVWTLAREGRLEDWAYWQQNGSRYHRAASAVVMLSLWAGMGYFAYYVIQSVEAVKKARPPVA